MPIYYAQYNQTIDFETEYVFCKDNRLVLIVEYLFAKACTANSRAWALEAPPSSPGATAHLHLKQHNVTWAVNFWVDSESIRFTIHRFSIRFKNNFCKFKTIQFTIKFDSINDLILHSSQNYLNASPKFFKCLVRGQITQQHIWLP